MKIHLNSSHRMPAIGLGTWKAEPELVGSAVEKAIDIGYRHIDCAKIYGNEAEIGRAISSALKANGLEREKLFVTSKLWNDSHAPEDVIPALKSTLKDLELEYLDLYLMHWPVALIKNAEFPLQPDSLIPLEQLPIADTWRAMEEAVALGLVKSIGVSNFSSTKLNALMESAKIPPAVNQVECHPFLQQKTLLETCAKYEIALTAYAPLGSGSRSEDMRVTGEESLLEHPSILKIADKHKASPAQVLLAWLLQKGIIAIPKSVSPLRLQENFNSQLLKLDEDDLSNIAQLDRGARYIDGQFFTVNGSPYTLENLWDGE